MTGIPNDYLNELKTIIGAPQTAPPAKKQLGTPVELPQQMTQPAMMEQNIGNPVQNNQEAIPAPINPASQRTPVQQFLGGTNPKAISQLNPMGTQVPWKNIQDQIINGTGAAKEINKHPILSMLMANSPGLSAQRQINNSIMMTNQYLPSEQQLQPFEINPLMGMNAVQQRALVAQLASKHVQNSNARLFELQNKLQLAALEHQQKQEWSKQDANDYETRISAINSAISKGEQSLNDPLDYKIFSAYQQDTDTVSKDVQSYYTGLQKNELSRSDKDLKNQVTALTLQQQQFQNQMALQNQADKRNEQHYRKLQDNFHNRVQAANLQRGVRQDAKSNARDAQELMDKAQKQIRDAIPKPSQKANKQQKADYETSVNAVSGSSTKVYVRNGKVIRI